jgi:hypothetical protein
LTAQDLTKINSSSGIFSGKERDCVVRTLHNPPQRDWHESAKQRQQLLLVRSALAMATSQLAHRLLDEQDCMRA